MAFCTKCGAQVDSAAKFCTKCGATMAGAVATTGGAAAAPAPIPQKQGSSALKVVLIVLGVVVLLGVLGLVALFGVGAYVVHKTEVKTDSSGNASVVTPFGKVETTHDSAKIAEDIGVPIYPGAVADDAGSGSVTFNNVSTSTVVLSTTDSPDAVLTFYKEKFPDANVVDTPDAKIVNWGKDRDTTTLTITTDNDKTKIAISRIRKK